MNTALWIVAGLLAAIYLAAGSVKLLRPKEDLAQQMKWTKDVSARTVHAIGLIEVVGAFGVVLPGASHVAVVLVPIAAVGLALVQVGAAITNLRHHELKHVPINIVLIAMAVFVAWGRFGPHPF
jgi:hypothetical protein